MYSTFEKPVLRNRDRFFMFIVGGLFYLFSSIFLKRKVEYSDPIIIEKATTEELRDLNVLGLTSEVLRKDHYYFVRFTKIPAGGYSTIRAKVTPTFYNGQSKELNLELDVKIAGDLVINRSTLMRFLKLEIDKIRPDYKQEVAA